MKVIWCIAALLSIAISPATTIAEASSALKELETVTANLERLDESFPSNENIVKNADNVQTYIVKQHFIMSKNSITVLLINYESAVLALKCYESSDIGTGCRIKVSEICSKAILKAKKQGEKYLGYTKLMLQISEKDGYTQLASILKEVIKQSEAGNEVLRNITVFMKE